MPQGWAHNTLPLSTAYLALVAAFALLWLRQLRTKNATSVDLAWSAAIGVLGLAWAAVSDGSASQRLLAGGIALLWSGRLSWHLYRDRVRGHADREDGRYAAMREHYGPRAGLHFAWFYQLQAAAAFAFAVPFAAIAGNEAPLGALQMLGAAVFLAAWSLESLADRQLAAHRRDPAQKGKACRRGLWRYSRHPNYFFEWVSWCGIGLCALPAAGWWAGLQPALMLVLVRFVSGVPFAEQQSLRSRGDDFRRYQQETNCFVPLPPRRR